MEAVIAHAMPRVKKRDETAPLPNRAGPVLIGDILVSNLGRPELLRLFDRDAAPCSKE